MGYNEEIQEMRMRFRLQICNEWSEQIADAVRDGIAPTRLMATIAQRHETTYQNVLKILKNAGLYSGAKETIKEYQKL